MFGESRRSGCSSYAGLRVFSGDPGHAGVRAAPESGKWLGPGPGPQSASTRQEPTNLKNERKRSATERRLLEFRAPWFILNPMRAIIALLVMKV